ncbi:disulfide bond formation protein B [Rubellimicrobium rubrum]|uniref:Disulfide bond formation protein B n=1 Tax=Rubellimicrobium rubrum TaxID=2585369 RepID=A0A5C4N072_9RHOB|nr:disulfide bond formation protein B [Rubellimicrobium rubrum]TNC51147.1 disulfide bond formation protein B [Rubellimicrobium rubrum]
MTRTTLIVLAAGGSFALLAGAYLFQALGYPPCALCWYQRYPHFAAVAIGALALAVRGPFLPILGSIAASATAILGAYHTGVERGWWQGPTHCTGGALGGLSGGDLLSVEGPRIVMCDQVAWELLGLSMASWNAVFSVLLMIVWIVAARRSATRAA